MKKTLTILVLLIGLQISAQKTNYDPLNTEVYRDLENNIIDFSDKSESYLVDESILHQNQIYNSIDNFQNLTIVNENDAKKKDASFTTIFDKTNFSFNNQRYYLIPSNFDWSSLCDGDPDADIDCDFFKNSILEIRYEFKLDTRIKLPENVTLLFNGGSFKNVTKTINGVETKTGALIGDKTTIVSGIETIFRDNLVLEGTFKANKAYPQWFGAMGNADADPDAIIKETKALQALFKFAGNSSIDISSPKDKTYIINNNLSLDYKDFTTFDFNNSTIELDATSTTYLRKEGLLIFRNIGSVKPLKIKSLRIKGNRNIPILLSLDNNNTKNNVSLSDLYLEGAYAIEAEDNTPEINIPAMAIKIDGEGNNLKLEDIVIHDVNSKKDFPKGTQGIYINNETFSFDNISLLNIYGTNITEQDGNIKVFKDGKTTTPFFDSDFIKIAGWDNIKSTTNVIIDNVQVINDPGLPLKRLLKILTCSTYNISNLTLTLQDTYGYTLASIQSGYGSISNVLLNINDVNLKEGLLVISGGDYDNLKNSALINLNNLKLKGSGNNTIDTRILKLIDGYADYNTWNIKNVIIDTNQTSTLRGFATFEPLNDNTTYNFTNINCVPELSKGFMISQYEHKSQSTEPIVNYCHATFKNVKLYKPTNVIAPYRYDILNYIIADDIIASNLKLDDDSNNHYYSTRKAISKYPKMSNGFYQYNASLHASFGRKYSDSLKIGTINNEIIIHNLNLEEKIANKFDRKGVRLEFTITRGGKIGVDDYFSRSKFIVLCKYQNTVDNSFHIIFLDEEHYLEEYYLEELNIARQNQIQDSNVPLPPDYRMVGTPEATYDKITKKLTITFGNFSTESNYILSTLEIKGNSYFEVDNFFNTKTH